MTVKSVQIKNFKSIVDLSLDLGEVNVFIGENGSGKSNILEALAFGSAAAANKLDHEFLASRGVRVTDARFMRSAFEDKTHEPVVVQFMDLYGDGVGFEISSRSDTPYPRWESVGYSRAPLEASRDEGSQRSTIDDISQISPTLRRSILRLLRPTGAVKSQYDELDESTLKEADDVLKQLVMQQRAQDVASFIIFAPENTALRTFEQEGQILPLGIHGEGLLRLLRVLASEDRTAWNTLEDSLRLLDWFSALELDHETSSLERSVRLRDRFLPESVPSFDQRSANEGFLYLLFFFALLISERTPEFFAVENVESSLNPKACTELMHRLAALAIEHHKQVLFTTHNPSLLDGLNLHDDRQRLFVVSRNRDGHTVARRIYAPRPVGNELPIRLSEAFTRGLLGGIPQNF